MSTTNVINPRSIKHGLGMFQVFRTLANKGRTFESLQQKPRVRLTREELAQTATIHGRPFNAGIINNGFANEAIRLATQGDRLAAVLLRHNLLKAVGLTAAVHGSQPAVIDLEPLYLTYLGPCQDMKAKLIQPEVHRYIKPEDIAEFESVDMGFEASFKANEAKDKILVTAPAIFADSSSTTVKRDPFPEMEKPTEVKGLILQGKDGGKRLEIRAKEPFSGTLSVVLPFITSFDWINLAPLNIEYKKR